MTQKKLMTENITLIDRLPTEYIPLVTWDTSSWIHYTGHLRDTSSWIHYTGHLRYFQLNTLHWSLEILPAEYITLVTWEILPAEYITLVTWEILPAEYITLVTWEILPAEYITLVNWQILPTEYITLVTWEILPAEYITLVTWEILPAEYITLVTWEILPAEYITLVTWEILPAEYITLVTWEILPAEYITLVTWEKHLNNCTDLVLAWWEREREREARRGEASRGEERRGEERRGEERRGEERRGEERKRRGEERGMGESKRNSVCERKRDRQTHRENRQRDHNKWTRSNWVICLLVHCHRWLVNLPRPQCRDCPQSTSCRVTCSVDWRQSCDSSHPPLVSSPDWSWASQPPGPPTPCWWCPSGTVGCHCGTLYQLL